MDTKISARRITTMLPVVMPTETTTHLSVSLYFSAGGINYFNCSFEQKGYYLSVSPVKLEGSLLSSILGRGRKTLVEGAIRFNQKKLELIWEGIARDIEESNRTHLTDMINVVAKEEKVGIAI